MCKKYDRNSVIEVDTWCGELVGGKPKPVCDIDERSQARHYVRVATLKTRETTVRVRGMMEGLNAKFESNPVVVVDDKQWIHFSDTEWVFSTKLYGSYGLHERIIGDAIIRKKSSGYDIVKVEVECDDTWSFLRRDDQPSLKRADSGNLVFKIGVV